MTDSETISIPTRQFDPVVITGIGLVASTGNDRESVWQAVQGGRTAVKRIRGYKGLKDDVYLGATVDDIDASDARMKVFQMCERAAAEALQDARVEPDTIDPYRFGCSLNAHMGDTSWLNSQYLDQPENEFPWWQQWMPNSCCSAIAQKHKLYGPRLSHSTACASSLISVISAVRGIIEGRCDIALTGGGDGIHPLFAAGFRRMGVLAQHDDPKQACRPFDRNRSGFVMGEGAAIFVVERLSHALERGASIYAEFSACSILGEAHHVTSLDADSEALAHLIDVTLDRAGQPPEDFGYINAHGTGTKQNDIVELNGIRQAFGKAADQVTVSSTKSMLGHLVNAAGGMELAITTLGLRDGFAPPTINLTDPDPICTLDCLPQVGREIPFQNALKLSVAFGGHLVAIALRRWNDSATGFAYPTKRRAA